jgi:ribosomal protein L27
MGVTRKLGATSRRSALLVLPLLLAGCGGPEAEPNATRSVVITGNENELIVPKTASREHANVIGSRRARRQSRARRIGTRAGDGGATRTGDLRDAARRGDPDAITKALGNPIEEGDNQECGAGALVLRQLPRRARPLFRRRQVRRLGPRRTRRRPISPPRRGSASARPGNSSNPPAAVTIEDSTLGIEFSAGDLSGLLSSREPDGEITNLWAGTTCIAR